MKPLPDDLIELYTRREVFAAAIWLHGLGVNATDLDDIIRNMSRSRDLGLHYVAPGAPLRPITINGGRPSRAWFDVFGDPETAGEDREGIRQSSEAIRELIDAERARGTPAECIVLGGFSQGAGLALHAGLHYPHRLAGIIMLSGELVLADDLETERDAANAQTPVLMVHGSDDETVPPDVAQRSRQRLEDLGYPVEWHEFPGGHVVTPEAVEAADAFTFRVLEPGVRERRSGLS